MDRIMYERNYDLVLLCDIDESGFSSEHFCLLKAFLHATAALILSQFAAEYAARTSTSSNDIKIM
jgi:hypothetical protein